MQEWSASYKLMAGPYASGKEQDPMHLSSMMHILSVVMTHLQGI